MGFGRTVCAWNVFCFLSVPLPVPHTVNGKSLVLKENIPNGQYIAWLVSALVFHHDAESNIVYFLPGTVHEAMAGGCAVGAVPV